MAFAIKKETTDRQLEYIWSKLDNLQEYWRCKQQYASPAYLKPYCTTPLQPKGSPATIGKEAKKTAEFVTQWLKRQTQNQLWEARTTLMSTNYGIQIAFR